MTTKRIAPGIDIAPPDVANSSGVTGGGDGSNSLGSMTLQSVEPWRPLSVEEAQELAQLPAWSIHEAAAIFAGYSPSIWKPGGQGDPFKFTRPVGAGAVDDWLDYLNRFVAAGLLRNPAPPGKICKHVTERGRTVPAFVVQALDLPPLTERLKAAEAKVSELEAKVVHQRNLLHSYKQIDIEELLKIAFLLSAQVKGGAPVKKLSVRRIHETIEGSVSITRVTLAKYLERGKALLPPHETRIEEDVETPIDPN